MIDKLKVLEKEIDDREKLIEMLKKLLDSNDPDKIKIGQEIVLFTGLDSTCGSKGLKILKRMNIGISEFQDLFHALWGACSCTSKYEKNIWGSMQKQLRAVGITT